MPVIILGNRGTLPIDPTFDDGGNIQITNSSVEILNGFSSNDPITVTVTTVSVGVAGSSTLNGNVVGVQDESVVGVLDGFATGTVQSMDPITTPNIVPPVVPSVSAPGGPAVDNFNDNGVIQVVGTSVTTGQGFISSATTREIIAVISSVPLNSSAFTTGDVTNGSVPPTNIDATIEKGFGLISPITVHVVGTQVVS